MPCMRRCSKRLPRMLPRQALQGPASFGRHAEQPERAERRRDHADVVAPCESGEAILLLKARDGHRVKENIEQCRRVLGLFVQRAMPELRPPAMRGAVA